MKLRGKAKRDFLARMARGRAKAARGRKRNPKTPRRRAARASRARKTRGARKAPSRSRKQGNKRTVARRRNPQILTIGNPRGRTELAKAVRAYERFHGVKPKVAKKGKGTGVWIELGKAREVIYEPTKGERRKAPYRHKFGRGAVLAASADGKRLAIFPGSGSRMRVDWARGIVG